MGPVCSGMLGEADAQQRGPRGLRKRQSCCFPWWMTSPEPCTGHSLPLRSRQREQQERPKHLQAMHRPSPAPRDTAGTNLSPWSQEHAATCALAAPSLSLEHPLPLPSPTPGRTRPLLCGAGFRSPLPGQGPPQPALTHWRGGQCLPSHQLAWPQPVEEVAELALGTQPGRGEDEPVPGRAKGFRGVSGCQFSSKILPGV